MWCDATVTHKAHLDRNFPMGFLQPTWRDATVIHKMHLDRDFLTGSCSRPQLCARGLHPGMRRDATEDLAKSPSPLEAPGGAWKPCTSNVAFSQGVGLNHPIRQVRPKIRNARCSQGVGLNRPSRQVRRATRNIGSTQELAREPKCLRSQNKR